MIAFADSPPIHVAPDWFARWIGIAGLVVAVLVFLYQLVVLGSRAKAVKKAVANQQSRTAASVLATVASEMRRTESDLWLAIVQTPPDPGKVQQGLMNWRTLAVDAQSYSPIAVLERTDELSSELETSLTELDYAITDVATHGPLSIGATMMPRISHVCRLAQSRSNAMMLEES